jgi:hypothetical protein
VTPRLQPGFYKHDHDKRTYNITGEFAHSEDGLLYVACIELVKPFTPYLITKETFEAQGCPAGLRDFGSDSPITPGLWRYFIGGDFLVHGEYYLPSFGEPFVAYRTLKEPFLSLVRRKDMFLEHVERPDIPYAGPRFRLIHAF